MWVSVKSNGRDVQINTDDIYMLMGATSPSAKPSGYVYLRVGTLQVNVDTVEDFKKIKDILLPATSEPEQKAPAGTTAAYVPTPSASTAP